LIIIYFIASETILNARLIGFAAPFIALPADGVWDWVPGLVNRTEANRAAAILTHVVQIPGRPEGRSDLDAFGQRQAVFYIDAEISDRVLDLGMPEQDLDRAEIARAL